MKKFCELLRNGYQNERKKKQRQESRSSRGKWNGRQTENDQSSKRRQTISLLRIWCVFFLFFSFFSHSVAIHFKAMKIAQFLCIGLPLSELNMQWMRVHMKLIVKFLHISSFSTEILWRKRATEEKEVRTHSAIVLLLVGVAANIISHRRYHNICESMNDKWINRHSCTRQTAFCSFRAHIEYGQCMEKKTRIISMKIGEILWKRSII